VKIYQVSCTVQAEIADDWQKLYLEKHLKDVFNTGCFVKYTFKKELSDSKEMITFVSEFHYESQADFDRYNANYAAALKKDVQDLFEGKYSCERSYYEVLK